MPDSTTTANRAGPFDQILEAEHERDERLRQTHADLERERMQKEDALLSEETAAVEGARAKAREELLAYKNDQLPHILKNAKEQAAAEVARIEREGASRVQKAADSVVDAALSDLLPSLL